MYSRRLASAGASSPDTAGAMLAFIHFWVGHGGWLLSPHAKVLGVEGSDAGLGGPDAAVGFVFVFAVGVGVEAAVGVAVEVGVGVAVAVVGAGAVGGAVAESAATGASGGFGASEAIGGAPPRAAPFGFSPARGN